MIYLEHLSSEAKKRWYTVEKPSSVLPPINSRRQEAESGDIVRNLEF